jgi:SAM-dependent methyltransferase
MEPEPTGDRMAKRTVESAAPRPPDPLGSLYEEQLKVRPDDPYLQAHAQTNVAETQAAVFEFYAPYLPSRGGCVLDWGCRHAPDACLIRARFGAELRIDGCDVVETGAYSVFHKYAGLHYHVLEDAVRLPYEDASFDAVVASGTLEHVPMDYESLKELYRVLRSNGHLIITYLPNRRSVEEWYKRSIRGEGFHLRLYGLGEVVELLKHSGFYPLVAGYQTHLDLLSARSLRHRILRGVRWILPLHWITSTISIIAAKMPTM